MTDNEKTPKHIKLNDRIIYLNEDFNFLLIEIKEDKDSIYNYFELDDNIICQETKKYLKQSIYILQNSEYKSYVSYGIISDDEVGKDYNFVHIARLKENSFFSPILNLLNNKLIGINIKQNMKSNSNIGLFFNYPLKEFLDKIYYKKMSLKKNLYPNIIWKSLIIK